MLVRARGNGQTYEGKSDQQGKFRIEVPPAGMTSRLMVASCSTTSTSCSTARRNCLSWLASARSASSCRVESRSCRASRRPAGSQRTAMLSGTRRGPSSGWTQSKLKRTMASKLRTGSHHDTRSGTSRGIATALARRRDQLDRCTPDAGYAASVRVGPGLELAFA